MDAEPIDEAGLLATVALKISAEPKSATKSASAPKPLALAQLLVSDNAPVEAEPTDVFRPLCRPKASVCELLLLLLMKPFCCCVLLWCGRLIADDEDLCRPFAVVRCEVGGVNCICVLLLLLLLLRLLFDDEDVDDEDDVDAAAVPELLRFVAFVRDFNGLAGSKK